MLVGLNPRLSWKKKKKDKFYRDELNYYCSANRGDDGTGLFRGAVHSLVLILK